MTLSRREFTHALALLGLGGCATPPSPGSADETALTLPNPAQIGLLTSAEKEPLWKIFRYIETVWKTKSDLPRTEFDAILDLKTGRPPAYLTVYRQAATLSPPVDQRFFRSAPAVVRQFVLAEFIELHLIYGGFRAFDLRNYKGAVGGTFDPKEPPYRSWTPA